MEGYHAEVAVRQAGSIAVESLQALYTENGRRFRTPLVCAGRLLTG